MGSHQHFLCLLIAGLLYSCSANQEAEARLNPHDLRIYQVKELNVTQIRSLVTDSTVVLLPGGIMEEHGPYLPSFTDGYWNEHFTDTLAGAIAGKGWKVLIFPTIPLGNSGANDIGSKYSFPGTYTIRFETLRSVFMDLATELGEQGFRRAFIIHGHGAPNHQRALDQAADFFNDTYGGHMVNLMGLYPVLTQWFNAPKTKAEEAEDGFTIHAGMGEASSMLYLVPQHVNPQYKNATIVSATDMPSLIATANKPDWPGYFGSERLATVGYGRKAWEENVRLYTRYALDILDGRINPDTIPRFGDYMQQSKEDVMLDSLSLREENRRKLKQSTWIKSNVGEVNE